ncbi:uncharacterized protein MYCFIDRAFT_173866 [Pseudocercospora fijiensis CIRAD86]|uniref:Uncharacterized protein n=1 Tax=Pseudocercospora fijiensis (strain CIRAD86) TaxID=383855 RepID=M3A1E7_PSEFD|nr:uncharacterized protein MYCFIDRAFT_173866 [Pseudocercospora fijiensis CIRAD86]EME84994.1 hypothetical protein MYCFIDRAFT_173866 [Pseudocercospora fijiensis CIRAD86]
MCSPKDGLNAMLYRIARHKSGIIIIYGSRTEIYGLICKSWLVEITYAARIRNPTRYEGVSRDGAVVDEDFITSMLISKFIRGSLCHQG